MIASTELAGPQKEQGRRQAEILGFCGLVLALALGVLPLSTWLVHGNSVGHLLAGDAIVWSCAVIILLWLTLVERLPLSSIGFRRPSWKGILFGILAAIVLTAIQVIQFAVIIPMFHLSTAAIMARQQAILDTPYWYRVELVLRAAFTEEVLFRGYLIEKVRQLFKSTALAVIVSVAAFTYAHLGPWGPVQLIAVSAGGLVFALLYVWRKDLPSNMLAHFLSDAAGFLR
jgi:membrane protease YdiL (CAAX protease family)